MNKDKIIVRERIFVPSDHLDLSVVEQHYKHKNYQDQACASCVYKKERHSYMCDECSAYLGETKLFNEQTIKGVQYVGLPMGHKMLLEQRLGFSYGDFKIVDKRMAPEFDYKIKFQLQLYDYQEKLRKDFMRKKYGLIEAPPRTGKTAILLRILCDLGLKAMFMADQHEFIEQFFDHIRGNEKDGIPKCTNLPELEEKHGKKLYGIPETDEDFENFQFFGMPYQQFSSKKGRERFERIKHHVGTLAIDEVHSASAPVFARVLSSFPSKYRFGVTGTVSRKDGKQYMIKTLIGPVVAKTKIEALTPTVTVHKTNMPKVGAKAWTSIMKKLCEDKGRNKQIVDQICLDIRNGRNCVVPIIFRKHADDLQKMIEAQMGYKCVAQFVGGGGKKNKAVRKQILINARNGDIKCVIGIRRLLQRGLNVKQWDTIFEIIPINNQPNLKQETARVCTPNEGKKKPRVRLFVDMNVGASLGCARASLNHMVGFKYIMAPKSQELISEIRSSGSRRRAFEEDAPGFSIEAFENESMGALDSVTISRPGKKGSSSRSSPLRERFDSL